MDLGAVGAAQLGHRRNRSRRCSRRPSRVPARPGGDAELLVARGRRVGSLAGGRRVRLGEATARAASPPRAASSGSSELRPRRRAPRPAPPRPRSGSAIVAPSASRGRRQPDRVVEPLGQMRGALGGLASLLHRGRPAPGRSPARRSPRATGRRARPARRCRAPAPGSSRRRRTCRWSRRMAASQYRAEKATSERPTCSAISWARRQCVLGALPVALAPAQRAPHHVGEAELAEQALALGQPGAGLGLSLDRLPVAR